jgi:hypothetical protein
MADPRSPTGNGTYAPPYAGRLSDIAQGPDLTELMLERGVSGLRRAGGYIKEDYLVELQGTQGQRRFREMRDTSPVVGACLFAIEMLCRQAPWTVEPADDSPEAQHYAELVEGMLFKDLDMPWSLLLSEILSFLAFGFDYREMVFKRRLGDDPPPLADGTPALPSLYDDGLIGFGKIAQRSQDTVLRWAFDSTGALLGMHQLDPWTSSQAYLPYAKCLLFRPTSYKQSPESKSVLRNAYRPWYLLTHIENIEGIGIERDLAGIPVIYGPPQWFSAAAGPEDVAKLEMLKRIGKNVRNDEQACIVFPMILDQDGHQLLTFQLASSGGRRAFDTNAIIQRYELRIAQSVLADIIFLGHEQVGSFALASSKTTTLAMALGGFLRVICDEFNRRALPLLWRLNAFDPALMPCLTHGDVESVDLKDLGAFLTAYAGVPSFEMSDLENPVRVLAGLPERQLPVSDAEEA